MTLLSKLRDRIQRSARTASLEGLQEEWTKMQEFIKETDEKLYPIGNSVVITECQNVDTQKKCPKIQT